MTGLWVLLLLGLAIFALVMVLMTAWILTHPPRRTYASAVARNRPGDPSELPKPRAFTAWTFPSRGRVLAVWDIPGDATATGRAPGPLVIMLHGWGDSKIGALARLDAVLPLASRVIALDLPGHGESSGSTSLGMSEFLDVQALIARLREELVPGSSLPKIVLFGWSLGAGIAIHAAVRADPCVVGVVAEAPYRHAMTPARRMMVIRGLPSAWNLRWSMMLMGIVSGRGWVGFDRASLASLCNKPLLVIHGTLDEISPVEDGRVIAGMAGKLVDQSHEEHRATLAEIMFLENDGVRAMASKLLEPGLGTLLEIETGGHYGLWTDTSSVERCREELRAFLARVLEAPTPPEPGS